MVLTPQFSLALVLAWIQRHVHHCQCRGHLGISRETFSCPTRLRCLPYSSVSSRSRVSIVIAWACCSHQPDREKPGRIRAGDRCSCQRTFLRGQVASRCAIAQGSFWVSLRAWSFQCVSLLVQQAGLINLPGVCSCKHAPVCKGRSWCLLLRSLTVSESSSVDSVSTGACCCPVFQPRTFDSVCTNPGTPGSSYLI